MAESTWRSTCCNPFQIQGHTARKSSLRPVSEWMCERNSLLHLGMKICDTCRKRLGNLPEIPDPAVDSESGPTVSSLSDSQSEVYEPSEQMRIVNQCLISLDETPVTKRKLQSKKYSKQKMEFLTMKMSEVIATGR